MSKTLDELQFLLESNAIEDEHDALSLYRAYEAWEFLKKRKTLEQWVILHAHKLLAPNGLEPDEIGVYRKQPVYIGGREGIHHSAIGQQLGEWLTHMNKPADPDTEIAEFFAKHYHIEYEKIHPFLDGNGRTGRMFYNWYRLKNGMGLDIINAAERQAYYKWFI